MDDDCDVEDLEVEDLNCDSGDCGLDLGSLQQEHIVYVCKMVEVAKLRTLSCT